MARARSGLSVMRFEARERFRPAQDGCIQMNDIMQTAGSAARPGARSSDLRTSHRSARCGGRGLDRRARSRTPRKYEHSLFDRDG